MARESDRIELGAGAEFDAIRAMLERWGSRAVGIGDDAAVLDVPRGDSLVVSIDSAVEHVHFKREWLEPREIGYRAVAAALSDLAAMASRPLGIVVAMTLPISWRSDLLEIADGVGDAADLARAPIRGGNMSDGSELTITTTVLGNTYAPLRRDGAKPGDHVFVTGRLGGPLAALQHLMRGEPAGAFRDRFANPVPRLAEGRWLAECGASAGIDVSDGLVSDLGHLAAASGVDIVLEAERVPCVSDTEVAEALISGEEYELLVTGPSGLDTSVFEARFGVLLTDIGMVAEASAGRRGVLHVHGVPGAPGGRVANDQGYDHFSR